MHKKIFSVLLFLPLLACLSSCADMEALSSYAKITGFTIDSWTPAAPVQQLGAAEIKDLVIAIPAGNVQAFPLTVNASIATDGYVSEVLGDDIHQLQFDQITSTQKISLITQSGVPVTYIVKLTCLDGIASFTINNYQAMNLSAVGQVNEMDNTVTVYAAQETFPLSVEPTITLQAGVQFKSYTPGTPITFASAATTYPLVLLYGEQEVTWTVKLVVAPQLPNYKLNDWYYAWPAPNETKEQPGLQNQLFWCTTNGPLAGFGTTKVAGESGAAGDYAAKMETLIKGAVGIERYGASSLFTGFFEMDLSKLAEPEKMARMGRPFFLRPSGMRFSAQYTPGPKFYKGNPPVEEPGTIDEGGAIIRLEHWTNERGQVLYNYNAVSGAEYDKVERTVVGAGELRITNTNNSGWKSLYVPLVYDQGKTNLPVTHIVINFPSSIDGAIFRVALNSVLLIDNVVLEY